MATVVPSVGQKMEMHTTVGTEVGRGQERERERERGLWVVHGLGGA